MWLFETKEGIAVTVVCVLLIIGLLTLLHCAIASHILFVSLLKRTKKEKWLEALKSLKKSVSVQDITKSDAELIVNAGYLGKGGGVDGAIFKAFNKDGSLEKAVKDYLNPKANKPKKVQEQSIELKELIINMQRTFATKVSAIGNDRKGRIYIDYYNRDDLDRICELIEKLREKGKEEV